MFAINSNRSEQPLNLQSAAVLCLLSSVNCRRCERCLELYLICEQNCAVLGYYTAYSGNSLPNFRDNLSLLVKNPKKGFYLDSWPIDCSETSIRNCHYTLCNIPEESRSRLLRGGSLKLCLMYELYLCHKTESLWNHSYHYWPQVSRATGRPKKRWREQP